MKIKAATPQGFRDFLPNQANARRFVLGKLTETFRSFGFEPLETPALEFAETLKGKYGEEEKLIYEFTTRGGDQLAMRYDQTVPLARVIAQYPELPKPFKRYQIQPVWRGERPQKGRYRELLQCDIDTAGVSSPLADAEIIACSLTAMKALGFKDMYMEVNDRTVFQGLENKYIAAIDKLKKIGAEGVIKELVEKGLSQDEAVETLERVESASPTENLQAIFATLKLMGFEEEKDFRYTPTLARGLDYYTGVIFELISPDYGTSSLGGGGRYDDLIGIYSGIETPATGFAFGFDRITEAMAQLNLLPDSPSAAQVLVSVFNTELLPASIDAAKALREKGVNTEVWLAPDTKLDKQFKYADQKGIPYVVIIGPDEAQKGVVTLKDLNAKTQNSFTMGEVVEKLTNGR